jgi:hypothetical protein
VGSAGGGGRRQAPRQGSGAAAQGRGRAAEAGVAARCPPARSLTPPPRVGSCCACRRGRARHAACQLLPGRGVHHQDRQAGGAHEGAAKQGRGLIACARLVQRWRAFGSSAPGGAPIALCSHTRRRLCSSGGPGPCSYAAPDHRSNAPTAPSSRLTWTQSTPATASCLRTRPLRGAARRRALPLSGHARRRSRWGPGRRRGPGRIALVKAGRGGAQRGNRCPECNHRSLCMLAQRRGTMRGSQSLATPHRVSASLPPPPLNAPAIACPLPSSRPPGAPRRRWATRPPRAAPRWSATCPSCRVLTTRSRARRRPKNLPTGAGRRAGERRLAGGVRWQGMRERRLGVRDESSARSAPRPPHGGSRARRRPCLVRGGGRRARHSSQAALGPSPPDRPEPQA